ncbi:putative acetyltransferase [Karstenula rhodostoma CBS 690.94]|uniref:Acetyltransferase n=1 Tax=Karstenula rhodostoma CBS 690.94 TaxID=1392251 RepID=A0A9P4UIE8_9PLEO|nr:putative acetyltransferase [Karstenula rhodostoma CBS 690.94]
MAVTVTPLTQQDHTQWATLWRQYLSETATTTLPDSQLHSTFTRLVAPDGDIHGLVLHDSETDNLLGLANFTRLASPWSEKGICYMSDLFVAENERSKGYERMLMDAVAEAGRRFNCRRVSWITQTDNAVARRLYDKLATSKDVYYRWDLE